MKNICVFASSSNNLEHSFYADAAELGKLLGENGLNIVYGGSRLGMMYACASKVKEYGGNIIGVMPQRLYDFGCGNPEDCAEFILTTGMRERKAKMDELSDAVIALAGGFGTLEEISEMIVQKQLGYNKKPIIFLNTLGFYDNLTKFFDSIINNGFAKDETKELYYVANTPKEALNYLVNYKIENLHYAGKF
jgi:uncharacterized protein (TIGR00730 family)